MFKAIHPESTLCWSCSPFLNLSWFRSRVYLFRGCFRTTTSTHHTFAKAWFQSFSCFLLQLARPYLSEFRAQATNLRAQQVLRSSQWTTKPSLLHLAIGARGCVGRFVVSWSSGLGIVVRRSMASSSVAPQALRCKAAVAWGAGEPLVMEEVEVDPPGPMELRVKVVCTSICRSDVNQWESQTAVPIFPRIYGHEAAGVVECVGDGVDEFDVGDHVLTTFIGECGKCRHCVSGKSNICQLLGLERRGLMHSDQKTRFSVNGKRVYHYCGVSSFSEYTVVHSRCAVKIPVTAPMDKLCLLSCGVAAGLGAAWKVANVMEGSTVAIFGLGTVGLSVAQGAKLRGASRVIGVDTNPEKLEKGKAFGVTDFINPIDNSEPVHQVIRRITDGGVDYAFECVGDTGVVSTALQSCCDGWGLTVTLGVPKMKPEVSAHYGLLLSGRTLKGTLFGGWKPKSELPKLVDMYLNKDIQIDELITNNFSFDNINEAFNLMKEDKCLRCVIHIN